MDCQRATNHSSYKTKNLCPADAIGRLVRFARNYLLEAQLVQIGDVTLKAKRLSTHKRTRKVTLLRGNNHPRAAKAYEGIDFQLELEAPSNCDLFGIPNFFF